jgi:type IV pilus assembly protein PilM
LPLRSPERTKGGFQISNFKFQIVDLLPIGVDIGSGFVKMVELVKKNNQFLLKNYASMMTGLTTDAKNAIDLEVTVEILKKTWSSLKTGNRNVAIAINQESVFTRVLEMPQMSDPELASSINWEAESYIPLPIAQVRFEWQVMKRYENATGQKRMDVLLIAVPREVIAKYYKLAELSGFELKILEPESVSIMRTLSLFKLDNSLSVIVNFGESKTDILVSNSGSVSFVRSLSTGGRALTRAIAKKLEIQEEQAENYKIAYGLDKTKLNGAVFEALSPVLQVIVDEVRRAIVFQQNKDLSKHVGTIVFCGGGSALPDLNVLISQSLNVEVLTADPFSVIKPENSKTKISSNVNQKFLVATGLSMGELT